MNQWKIYLSCLVILAMLTIGGCSTNSKLARAMRLQDYSNNQDAQDNLVMRQNRNFNKLVAAIQKGELDHPRDLTQILKTFGEPISYFRVTKADTPYEVWLYRYSHRYFKTSKVYLYFDMKGKLCSYDYFAVPEPISPNPDLLNARP